MLRRFHSSTITKTGSSLRFCAASSTNTTSPPTNNTSYQTRRLRRKVKYDEDANTTTYCSDEAAEVISATFGVQQNIKPSWGWEQMNEQKPVAEDDKDSGNVKNDNSNQKSSEQSSLKSDIANFDKEELPQLHKMTEGEILSSEGDENEPTATSSSALASDEEKMREEMIKEQKRNVPPSVSPEENFMLEFQKYYYKKKGQVGPYIGSSPESEEKEGRTNKFLALRQRREIERVPQYQEPYLATETSFRRLPPSVKLPNERHLRFCYPMKTDLPIKWKDADLADFNMASIDEEPAPMKYGVLYPRNYDPNKPHPTMVWLSDHRGEQVDFEDSCAHLFQRGPHYQAWYEKGWVIYSPMITVRHAQLYPQEGVVARFCDWVCANHNVEHGRVHLSGKGYGAFTALRSVLEMKHLAISCTALCGRLAGPFRPMERPQDKAVNIDGTHVLIYVPGDMRKTEYIYKFKGFCDLAKVNPPVRCVHFADIRDHQVYYAVNPVEFWNYMEYFRTHNMHQPVVY